MYLVTSHPNSPRRGLRLTNVAPPARVESSNTSVAVRTLKNGLRSCSKVIRCRSESRETRSRVVTRSQPTLTGKLRDNLVVIALDDTRPLVEGRQLLEDGSNVGGHSHPLLGQRDSGRPPRQ